MGAAISSSRVETEYNLGGKPPGYQATVDILTSFTIIIGIFFPSVTGTTISFIQDKFCLPIKENEQFKEYLKARYSVNFSKFTL